MILHPPIPLYIPIHSLDLLCKEVWVEPLDRRLNWGQGLLFLSLLYFLYSPWQGWVALSIHPPNGEVVRLRETFFDT